MESGLPSPHRRHAEGHMGALGQVGCESGLRSDAPSQPDRCEDGEGE